MSNIIKHAEREFELAGYNKKTGDKLGDEMNAEMKKNVMQLLGVFANQGHSGMSAPMCIELFRQLALFKILTPLTGEDDEWRETSEPVGNTLQNIRASNVFKDKDTGKCRDIEGRVFIGHDGTSFTSRESSVEIDFPYTPEVKYVQLDENGVEDYDQMVIDSIRKWHDEYQANGSIAIYYNTDTGEVEGIGTFENFEKMLLVSKLLEKYAGVMREAIPDLN